MTANIAAESIILGALLLTLVLAEANAWLRRRRASAVAYIDYCNEIVDKETER